MASKRDQLLAEVRKQIEHRLDGSAADLDPARKSLAYLAWLTWHCGSYAAVPSFLDAARADIVAILYAGAVGMERTAYVHARSLLENLVRHCYFDSRPALFVTRQLDRAEDVRDIWADLFKEIKRLPHFRPALGDTTEPSVFAEIEHVYQHSSRFVHGSTARYRSICQAVRAIDMNADCTRDLDRFLQRLSEACLLLLALYHLGPYLLISQSIRRHMLCEAMDQAGRARFLGCMDAVSLTWAQHQRGAALQTWRERKRRPILHQNGVLIDRKGSVYVANPGP